MFEAIVTLCLSLSEGPCRDQLLPGYRADTFAECSAALASRPPDTPRVSGLETQGDPVCKEAGNPLQMEKIAPGVFVHKGVIAEPDRSNRGDVSNFGFVVGNSSVAVIDTGGARWVGEALWRSIRDVTDLPVTHVVLTHMHPDHVFGTGIFVDAGAQVVGHARLERALADRVSNYLESLDMLIGTETLLGTHGVAVDIPVSDRLEIDLGDRRLALRAWPMAHTGTDVTVVDIATGTLFAGDLVFDGHTPTLDGRLTGWRAVLDTLTAEDHARVVPGHGGPVLPWPDGAADTMRYLEVLEADTRAAVEAGLRLGDAVERIGRSEAGKWELFDAYTPRNATVAFTELEWE
jgi:quinoprotein relay system zinc metallohydrolase 2